MNLKEIKQVELEILFIFYIFITVQWKYVNSIKKISFSFSLHQFSCFSCYPYIFLCLIMTDNIVTNYSQCVKYFNVQLRASITDSTLYCTLYIAYHWALPLKRSMGNVIIIIVISSIFLISVQDTFEVFSKLSLFGNHTIFSSQKFQRSTSNEMCLI